ncbi:MAG: hypothetical protein WA749_04210 [Gelidibacter sp.]
MAQEKTKLPFLRLRCTTVNSFPSLTKEGSWKTPTMAQLNTNSGARKDQTPLSSPSLHYGEFIPLFN